MSFRRACSSGLLLLSAAGCGSSGDEWTAKRPAVVPAQGVVTYQGKPVEGATVVLSPVAAGGPAYDAAAMTNSDGQFELSAFQPDPGAVPGKYKVAISKVEGPAASTKPLGHDEIAPNLGKTKYLVPQKYGNPETSGLTIEIPDEGKTDIKFELQ